MALTWQQKLNQQYSSKIGSGQVSETQKSASTWQAKLNQQYKTAKVSIPVVPSVPPQIIQQRQAGLAKFGITEPEATPIKINAPELAGGPGLGFEFTSNITPQAKIEARQIAESMKNKIRGGTWAETEEEVDHKIPVALGGTEAPHNLQALKSSKTISQTFSDWLTGKNRLPGEYKPQNRQEGKMIVEWDIIDKFQNGALTQGQAIYNILQYNWADENAKNKIEDNVLKGVQEWETTKQTPQIQKPAQPSAVDLATQQIKSGLKSTLDVKPLLKGAGESVTMPLDFLHRTGLQVINAVAPLYTTTVGALVKLSGNEDFKNISLDTIWKDSLEKAGDRMLGIGAPTEALKPLIGRQVTPVAIPELEQIYEQQTAKLIEADKNYDVGKFLKEGAIMGFAKFTEDWANPFWLFDIKGFSAGSFKKDFGEKTIYEQSFQYNPAKEDFLRLKGKVGKGQEKTGVFDIEVQPNEDLNKVVAEISEKGKVTFPKVEKPPKLKGYITVKSTGDVNVKITNSGGEVFNKDIIKQIADKPKVLTAGEVGKEADIIFEQQFFKHPLEDIAGHINRAVRGSNNAMTPLGREVLSIDLSKIKSIDDFRNIVTQTIKQSRNYQVLQDPATLKNIQFGIDTNINQFYQHLNEPVMFEQWVKNGYITLAPKVSFGNIAPVVPSTAIKTGIKSVEEVVKVGGKVSKEVKALTEEATKYKTADEFIKKQTPFYRGSDKIEKEIVVNTDKDLSYGSGVYLTDNENIAKEYGKNVSKIYPIKDIKLKQISEIERQEIVNLFGKEQKDYIESLLEDKYDGLKIPEREGDGNEIVIYNPNILKTEEQLNEIWESATQKVPTIEIEQPLLEEAKKYKTAEEFVKNKPVVYHGSPTPLKSFSNKKGGVFFTEEYADATGFAGSPDNVYEGYLNFKKPLEIDAKGAKWDELNTKYGKSTQEVISNAQKDGYDGVVFKNIVDNIGDTADWGGQSTIYYAYKPKDAFINESQLTDIWNKANKVKEKETLSTPETREKAVQKPVKFTSGEVRESKAFKRLVSKLKTENPEMPEYKVMNLAEDRFRAEQFVKDNPEIAEKVAKGLELPPEGITQNAVTNAVIEKAIADGDFELAAKLSTRLSLRATRQGQEIASLKEAYGENDPQYFVNLLLQNRVRKVLKITYKQGEPKLSKLSKEVKEQAKVTRRILDKRAAKIQSAQDIINSIIC